MHALTFRAVTVTVTVTVARALFLEYSSYLSVTAKNMIKAFFILTTNVVIKNLFQASGMAFFFFLKSSDRRISHTNSRQK